MTTLYDRLNAAAAAVQQRAELRPRTGVVLGSWLGELADEVDGTCIPYAEIPHLPRSTTPEQRPELIVGRLAGRPVAVLASRVHLYEGFSAAEVAFPVQLLARLGVDTLILTNSAGSLDPELPAGSLMLIADQINQTGQSPLVGPNDPRIGPRYPDLSQLYDPGLRALARSRAEEAQLTVGEGIYLGILGPNFQTPAEVRAARLLGADAVGMSTVIETIAAAHAGLSLLGVSAITDVADGRPPNANSVDLPALRGAIGRLLTGVLASLPARRSSPVDQLTRQASRRK